MQLIVNVKNESVADKIKAILNVFKADGVEVKELSTARPEINEDDYRTGDNWREVLLGTHSADLDDDEVMYDAYGEFVNDKYSH
jgi:hypothetical protein